MNDVSFEDLTTNLDGAYALASGSNTITAQVTAEDGSKGRIYTIVVER